MKPIYLFFAIYLLQPGQCESAATKTKKQKPSEKAITAQFDGLIPGGIFTLKIPLADTEPLTGETFDELTEKSFKKCMPLPLVHIMYVTSGGISTETVDLYTLMRIHGSLDKQDLIDGNEMIKRIKDAFDRYSCSRIDQIKEETISTDAPLRQQHIPLTSFARAFFVGTDYKGSSSINGFDMIFTVDDKTKKIKNQSFITLALRYKFSKKPKTRKLVLVILDSIYKGMCENESCAKKRSQLSDTRQKLSTYFNKKYKERFNYNDSSYI